jgi:hypothetical protein
VTRERRATISAGPALNQHTIYRIDYTQDGHPAGRSLARAEDLESWKTDLAAHGWTVEHTPGPQQERAEQ